ncbi:50S ribosomal protein L21 [Oscillatoria amoena NRMC-F 0135]|nr:50S ribosomal protein L21 [Oscillatoria amoena NRMC-F 0135]
MSYAVLRTGSKQYKVVAGDTINIELLEGVEAGTEVSFDDILLVGDGDKVSVGTPVVKGAKVTGEIIAAAHKAPKVTAYKFKRRKGYHRTVGHRQQLTKVKIKAIVGA